MAGYKDDIQKCFFAYNKGLERRFNYTYELEPYSAQELREILILKVTDQHLVVDNDNIASAAWFETNKKMFKYYGGDVESLVTKAKIAHFVRVFCLPEAFKGRLNQDDFEHALQHLKQGRALDQDDDDNTSYRRMFM